MIGAVKSWLPFGNLIGSQDAPPTSHDPRVITFTSRPTHHTGHHTKTRGRYKMNDNQKITTAELSKIRKLNDFDLVMLISEIHDHGWPTASKTLAIMPITTRARGNQCQH